MMAKLGNWRELEHEQAADDLRYQARLAELAAKLDEDKKLEAGNTVFALYQSKILTSAEADLFLLAMGFSTVKDSKGTLRGYY
jgi:hypothetical protein